MAKPVGHGGRDYPDFGIITPDNPKFNIPDLSEVSSRLGSPNLFDRTGTLLWFEQFSYGLNNWTLDSNAHGNDPVLVATPCEYKPYAVKLSTKATGAGSSEIACTIPYPYAAAMGLEYAFYPVEPITSLVFGCLLTKGGQRYTYSIQLLLNEGYINVLTTGPAYETVYYNPLKYHVADMYNIIKVVIDLKSETYSRLLFNDTNVDVSTIPLVHTGSTVNPKLDISCTLAATNLQAEVCYLDNIIFTLDEPL